MTRNRFITGTMIVVALFGLVLAIQLAVRYVSFDSAEDSDSKPARIFEFDGPTSILSVEVENGSRILEFERVPIEDGAARNDGANVVLSNDRIPARADRLESYLEELHEMRRRSLVTDNSERYGELMVERGTAFSRGYDFRVALTTESDVEREALFGLSSDSSDVFVRMAGEDAVYRVEDTVSFYMDQGPQYWAELRLFAGQFPLETVESIQVDTRSDGEWVTVGRLVAAAAQPPRFERESGGDRADYRRNERAVRSVLSLEADGYIGEGPAEPSWRITAVNQNGDRVRVHVGAKTGEGIYPADIVSGQEHLTSVDRGPMALRADLFETMLERME